MSTREERLELRLQGAAAYIRSTAAASRSSLRQNHQPPQQQQQPQRQSLQRPLRSATKSLTPLPHRNSELLLLQEKRERAREQERKEREKEKERLDREELIPDSKKAPQVLAAVSVSTGCISYGICMAYTSSAIPSMLSPNNSLTIDIGIHETTWMSSLLALGALVGSLSAVYLMDAVGRKASLLAFSVMSLFIGWTLLMAASQFWQLYAGRFLLGLGAGLEITISPVYIHEICRPVLRDVCGSFPQVFIAVGVLLCYAMGRDLEWNWLALVSCVFLFPFTFGLYFIPESPPWLVYNDEEDLAFKSMVLIRGEEYDATVEIRRIKDNLAKHRNDLHALLHADSSDYNVQQQQFQQHQHLQPEPRFEFKDLFQPAVLHPLIVILVLMFLLQFSGQGAVTFYTALIFRDAECALDPKESSVIVGLSYLLSSILGLFLKKHLGRRLLLLISELGMAAAQFAMGVYFYYLNGGKDDERSWLPIPILVIYTVAFNVGMGSLTWVVATEILPVRSKRWTHTISNVTSNFWWFVVTKTFRDLSDVAGPSVPFFLYGSVCIFGFAFIFLFLPETHGKSAEETAASFAGMPPALRLLKKCFCCCCSVNSDCWPLTKLKFLTQARTPPATATATPSNQIVVSEIDDCER